MAGRTPSADADGASTAPPAAEGGGLGLGLGNVLHQLGSLLDQLLHGLEGRGLDRRTDSDQLSLPPPSSPVIREGLLDTPSPPPPSFLPSH